MVLKIIQSMLSFVQRFLFNSPLGIFLNSNFTHFKTPYTIKNSLELTNLASEVKIPSNMTLVSFDISNMFPGIPGAECLTLITNILNISNINQIIRTNMLRAFELCLSQNSGKFNDKMYIQKQGLGMRSFFSPLLTEIFNIFA